MRTKLSKYQEQLTVDVKECAACGKNHKAMRFDLLPKKLRVRKGGYFYAHVARCANAPAAGLVYLTTFKEARK